MPDTRCLGSRSWAESAWTFSLCKTGPQGFARTPRIKPATSNYLADTILETFLTRIS